MAETAKSKSAFERWSQIGGLVVGVVAVLATIFFSVRSERTKELTVTYLTKRPLVSIEGARASVGLEVRLGGNPVNTPWLLSGRLENTGNQPIEERDVEAPVKVSFSKAKVVGAEIVQRSQPALFANPSLYGNAVTIEHKLLNAGDWLNFDILFDGEPDVPPSLTFRISGVSQPKQRVVSPGEKRAFPSVVPIPTPLLYLLLAIGSLTGAAGVIAGLILLGQSIRNIFPQKPKQPAGRKLFPELDPSQLLRRMAPSSRGTRMIYPVLEEEISLDLLDQPDALRAAIVQKVPAAILQAAGFDPERAASTLRAELKESLKDQMARDLFINLPTRIDRAVQSEVQKLDASSMSARELLGRAVEIATGALANAPSVSRIDPQELALAFVVLLIGVSPVMLLGGTWRTILAV